MKINVLAGGMTAVIKARHLAEGSRSVPGRQVEVTRNPSE